MTLDPTFHFLEVAYPYIARRLLTDEDPALRQRLIQVSISISGEAHRGSNMMPRQISMSICASHCICALHCIPQVLFSDGKFQWKRLENLIALAREGVSGASSEPAGAMASIPAISSRSSSGAGGSGGLDLSDTVKDALRVLLVDEKLRAQVSSMLILTVMALASQCIHLSFRGSMASCRCSRP